MNKLKKIVENMQKILKKQVDHCSFICYSVYIVNKRRFVISLVQGNVSDQEA